MLEMRPNCECCDVDLPADVAGAFHCSFECTFCKNCTEEILHFNCPNCGDLLVERPLRSRSNLETNPASTVRILKAEGCK